MTPKKNTPGVLIKGRFSCSPVNCKEKYQDRNKTEKQIWFGEENIAAKNIPKKIRRVEKLRGK